VFAGTFFVGNLEFEKKFSLHCGHFFLYIHQSLQKKLHCNQLISKRDLTKFQLGSSIGKNPFFTLVNDIDEMADFFTNKYLEMAKECIPTKVVNIRRTDKPWFNSEIRHHIRIRDRLHRKLKSSPTVHNIWNLKRNFRCIVGTFFSTYINYFRKSYIAIS
jgi:hypothetical protein